MARSSVDPLLGQKITVLQPENGYRFSMDPFILAAHLQVTGNENVIDIGCGCGIMPLILASRYPNLNILGVEIQKELFWFARQNIIENGLNNTVRIRHNDIKDVRRFDKHGKADMIISNPPYKKKDSGRVNPNSQKAIARHEIFLDIEDLFKCSSRLLNEHGRLYVIFPAERLPDLILAMEPYNFSPDTIRFVHTKKDTAAKRLILCAAKNSRRPCTISPPFYIYTAENKFTDEYTCLFRP